MVLEEEQKRGNGHRFSCVADSKSRSWEITFLLLLYYFQVGKTATLLHEPEIFHLLTETLRRGVKKSFFFVVFDYEGGGGVRRKCKKTTKLFYKLCFFGVFQNDPGPPKYALELRGYVKYMFFPPFHCSL